MTLAIVDQWVTYVCSGVILSTFAFFGIFLYPKREWTEETKRRPRSFISNALFREFWYFVMGPLKTKLIQWEVNPNTITTFGLIFSIAAGMAFMFDYFGIGGWLVIAAATCDVYDGMLARAKKINLKSGAFYDSLLDRVGEILMLYGLLWHFSNDVFWFTMVFLALSASQIVSYARSRAEGLGFDGGKGFFQRAERMIVMSIGLSAVPMVRDIWGADAAEHVVQFVVVVLGLGSFQTAIGRSWDIYRTIRAAENA